VLSGSAVAEVEGCPNPRWGDFRIDIASGVAITNVTDTPATPLDENLRGHPVLMGTDVGYYWRDWLGAEFWSGYQFDIHRWQFLVGPRLRVRMNAFSLALGLKGGLFASGPNLFAWDQLQAGVSSDAAVELELGGHVFLGLRYALDIAVQHGPILTHRIALTEGWRF
jgi:hypothetical protein